MNVEAHVILVPITNRDTATRIIQSPADTFCLPVSPVRQLQLIDELTEYADRNPTAATTLWEETQTQLLCLLPDEERHLSEQLATYLYHLAYNAGYVIRLGDSLFPTLTILDDSGQGFYLLFPPSAIFTGAAELIAMAEPSEYQPMRKAELTPVSTVETQSDLYVITGEAEKTSPHSTGLLHWEMTGNLDRERGLRIMASDSGGLFSRGWIALSTISGVLKVHKTDDFTSTALHPLFASASRNNTGFLAATLRCADTCLTGEGSDGAFSHRCYPDREKRLEKLLTFSPST